MKLKERLIWTVLGINHLRTLERLLNLAETFRNQSVAAKQDYPTQDPTDFLPSFAFLRVVTVEEALSPDYAYPAADKAAIVGQWPGDESVEEPLPMLNS